MKRANSLKTMTSISKFSKVVDMRNNSKKTIMNNLILIIGFFLVSIFGCILVGCNDDDKTETETSISYTLTISPDLLKFVTPQVSYIDENGVLVTIKGVEDLDGKVIENSAEVEKGGSYGGAWSSMVITGTGYKCWTLKMKFKRLNYHSYMGVKYIRNDFIEDSSGKMYDFHHNINTSVSSVIISGSSTNTYQDTYVSKPVGDYHFGDNIETYLNDLYKNPDKVGYYVDGNGKITRKDDFEL